jgi:hypothetical protein
MKKFLVGAGMLLGAVAPASAVEVWQGDLFLTVVGGACKPNWGVNDFVRAVFRPANLSDNGPDSRLALFSTRVVQRYTVAGGPFKSGSFAATGIFSSTNMPNWTGTLSQVNVKPATQTASTPSVTIKARISNFSDIDGCIVTLEGVLGKRPDL